MKFCEVEVQTLKKSYEQVIPKPKRKRISKVKIKAPSNGQYKVSRPGTSSSRCRREEEGPLQYSVYCIVNSGFLKSKGSLIASVVRGCLDLYNKMARNRVKVKYLDYWEESGEKIVIMKGINHKHLEYLAEELYFAAVDIHSFYKTWSRNKILLVLSVLGKEEDLEELLEGLSELR